MAEDVENKGDSAMGAQKLFCGDYRHTLDDRRRLTIPADWRAMSGEPRRLFVMKSPHGPYLQVLPAHVASERMAGLAGASLLDKAAQERNKIIAMRTEVVPWDSQGRVRLREDMLAYAGISDRVLLVGCIGGFEIWKDAGTGGEEKTEPGMDEIMAAFSGTGL